jgi:ligand-binding sensor domain-containing protein
MQIVDSLLYTAGDDGVVVVNLNDNSDQLYDRNTKFHNAELKILLVHQGVIWVGGSSGLFRLNKRTGNWYRYTTNDGLVSQRISGLAGDGDYVWIGTDQGVTRFFWKVFNRSDWLE